MARTLQNLTFDSSKFSDFRSFYHKLRSLTISQFPNVANDVIDKVSIQEFRLKVPRSISSDPVFDTCYSKDPIEIVELAQSIFDRTKDSSLELNALPEPKTPPRDKYFEGEPTIICYRCNQPNHIARYCQAPFPVEQ